MGKFYSALKEGKIEELVESYLSVEKDLNLVIWSGKEEELRERLQSLSRVTKQLPEHPAMKEFDISSFGDYRSNWGGKISSWISNTQEQKEGIVERLNKHIEKLEEISKRTEELLLEENIQDESQKEALQKNRDRLGDILTFAYSLREQIDPATHRLYTDELHRWRTYFYSFLQDELNHHLIYEFGGKKIETKDDESISKEIKKVFGELGKDLNRIPEFPGDRKKEKIKRYLKSPKLIKSGIEFLIKNVYQGNYHANIKHDDHLDESKINELIRKKLDMLRMKHYHTASSVAKQIIATIFK